VGNGEREERQRTEESLPGRSETDSAFAAITVLSLCRNHLKGNYFTTKLRRKLWSDALRDCCEYSGPKAAAAATDAHASPATIRVTVLVVVVTLVVVITVVVVAPLWTLSVVEIGGFFTTCCLAPGSTGLSRQ